jgi:hypothetical protein
MNAAYIVQAIDDPDTGMHAHAAVRPQAIAIAHAAVAVLMPISSPPPPASPSEIMEAYDMARQLIRAASAYLLQIRRETLEDAARTVARLV